jgi:hypothetical protein
MTGPGGDEAQAEVTAHIAALLQPIAAAMATAGMFVCSGRGDPDHSGTVSVSVTTPPPSPGRRGKAPAIEFSCPACGRRTRFGARRMSQIREAVKDGRLTGPVDISLC